MCRTVLGMLLALSVTLCSTVVVGAQPEQPAPAPNAAKDHECDDLCKLGRALNQKDSAIHSQSGTGRGVVTKVPVDKQLDYRPAEGNFNSRIK
jgi:hypothetical protein